MAIVAAATVAVVVVAAAAAPAVAAAASLYFQTIGRWVLSDSDSSLYNSLMKPFYCNYKVSPFRSVRNE